jgi:hypothetical protein
MSAEQSIVVLVLCTMLFSALLGGIGGAVIVSISTRRSIEVRPAVDGVLDVPVQLHSEPVALRVRATVAEIEPIVIQVATAPLPNVQDMAARILARFPDAGPTDIAEIAGCAKSTAHAIIADYKTGFGAALQPVDQG